MSSTAYVDIRPQGSVAPPPPQPQTAHDTPDEPVTPDPDPQVGGNEQHGTVNARLLQPQEMGEPRPCRGPGAPMGVGC